MAGEPLCDRVTDVTGGVRTVCLSSPQLRFLASFLTDQPDRLRVVWKRSGRVVEKCQADAVEVYRVGQGDGPALRGFPEGRRTLRLSALDELQPYWETPLRTLNAEGRRVAMAPPPEPLSLRSFKLPAIIDRALAARAAAERRTVSAVLTELVREHLRSDL